MPDIIIKKKPPVERVRTHMENAVKGRHKELKDWRTDFKLYRSYIDMTKRDKRRSNAFIPLIFPLVESSVARYVTGMMGIDPIVSVLPRMPDDYAGAQLMQMALQMYLEKAGIFLPMSEAARIMVIFADAFVGCRWQTEYQTVEQEFPIQEYGITVGYEKRKVQKLVYDGLWFDCYAPYQVYPDSQASIDQCKGIVLEDFWPHEDLLQMEKDGKVTNIKKEVQPISTQSRLSSEQDLDKFTVYKEIGYETPEDQEGMVKVWRYFADDHWWWIANENTLIFDEDNPHEHSKKPIAHFPKVRQHQRFFSMSSIRPAARLQNLYNTLFDQVMDRNNQTLHPWILYKRGAGIDRNQLISSPNNVIETTGEPSQSIYVHTVPPLTGEPGALMQMIKAAFDEVTGYFGYQRGHEESKRTATEAEIISSGGDQRIRFDMMVYESFGMTRLAELAGSDIQQFMPPEVQLRVFGSQGMQFPKYSADDLRGQYDYRFTGSTAAYNREVDRAQLLEMVNLIANFEEINRYGLLEVIVDAVPSLRSAKEKILNQPMGAGIPGPPGMAPAGPPGQVQSVGQTSAVTNPQTFRPPRNTAQAIAGRHPRVRAVS